MIALICFCLISFTSLLKSKSRLEAENVILRHQLIVLQRQLRGRIRLTDGEVACITNTFESEFSVHRTDR